jgi:hypothetical protein
MEVQPQTVSGAKKMRPEIKSGMNRKTALPVGVPSRCVGRVAPPEIGMET